MKRAAGKHLAVDLALTDRDLELLDFVVKNRACPLSLLAARFYAFSEKDGGPNVDPQRACLRRVRRLVKGGHVKLRSIGSKDARGGTEVTKVVYSTDKAARTVGGRKSRALSPRNRAHHLGTLRAIDALRDQVERRGGRIVKTKLEADLRSDAQHGRPTRPGQEYEAFPDALVTIELPRDSGTERLDVAVEYVTAKYAAKDIKKKAAGFQGQDRTLWVADKPSTKARVERLTGEPCTCL